MNKILDRFYPFCLCSFSPEKIILELESEPCLFRGVQLEYSLIIAEPQEEKYSDNKTDNRNCTPNV